MAVKIRLKRMGKIRAPFYRIVVADSRTKRDGRVIEEIGKYHPKSDPSFIEVDAERAQYWLGVGAQPSEPVMAILKLTGDWQRFKGEPAPAALKVVEPKRAKAELFNEALKDAHGDPGTEAVTRKRTTKKAASGGQAAAKAAADSTPEAPGSEAVGSAAAVRTESVPVEPMPEVSAAAGPAERAAEQPHDAPARAETDAAEKA